MNDHERRLCAVFHSAPLAKTMGMRLHYEDGQAVFTWPYDARFDHAMQDVHGGVIATMLDNAGFFAAAVHYETWIVTVEFHTRFLAPAGREALRGTANVVRHGSRMATTEMRVHNESGTLVAMGTASLTATRNPLPETGDDEAGS